MTERDTAMITGIGGFVGMYLARYLLSQGLRVTGTVFTAEDKQNVRILTEDPDCPVSEEDIEECDLRDSERITRLISEIRPHQIYHLAAVTFVPTSFEDPRMTFEINLLGTLNLFNALLRASPHSRVLCVSSADIYGLIEKSDLPIQETCPLRPLSPYAVSKASADLLGFQFAKTYGLHVVRARPFNHTGPGQSSRFVCSDFTRQVAEIETGKRDPVLLTGDLSARRDFSDVRDVVEAYFIALRSATPGEAYNICSGNAYSIEEILSMVLNFSRNHVEVRQSDEKMRPSDIEVTMGDNRKLREATGWGPKIPLEQTISDMLNDWRERV